MRNFDYDMLHNNHESFNYLRSFFTVSYACKWEYNTKNIVYLFATESQQELITLSAI